LQHCSLLTDGNFWSQRLHWTRKFYVQTLLKSILLATGMESNVQPVLRRLGTGQKTDQNTNDHLSMSVCYSRKLSPYNRPCLTYCCVNLNPRRYSTTNPTAAGFWHTRTVNHKRAQKLHRKYRPIVSLAIF